MRLIISNLEIVQRPAVQIGLLSPTIILGGVSSSSSSSSEIIIPCECEGGSRKSLGSTNHQGRKRTRVPGQLSFEGGLMIAIDMGVTHDESEGTGDEIADVGKHVGEQSVGGDIERNAETDVTRSLI